VPPSAGLLRRLKRGDQAALSRVLSLVVNESPGHEALARQLFAEHGSARKIGFCGPPGSGKSSLINRLVGELRKAGLTVGVLAVDPTSPFTGGAFLGDRLRVQEHALDEGVFFRSLATRGMMGGLSSTIYGAVHALEAFGFDRILLETVGTGQDEVDIAEVADTVVSVTAPYQGDEFQAMKAGAMEIADVFAVNKADLEDVDRTVGALRDALGLGPAPPPGAWQPKVAAVSARTGEGVARLAGLFDEHGAHLEASGEGRARRGRQLRRELALHLSRRVYQEALGRISDRHIDLLVEKKADPLSLGRELLGERQEEGSP
jgi:LAO/AO transport system kinase